MQTTTAVPQNPNALRKAWIDLKREKSVRNRDAATQLGVSEAELVASCCGENVTRLHGDFRDLLKRVPELGRVMALTRNASCVHERDGSYEDVSANGHVGLVLGPDIDLRIFFSSWASGFAATDESPRGTMRSLQFYDQSGEAVHKIYLRPASNVAAYEKLVTDFRSDDQSPALQVEANKPRLAPLADSEIDVDGLRMSWAAMQDTHEFFGLLKKYKTARIQALRLAGVEFAHPAPLSAARSLLEDAAKTGVPIMVFVGNPGCIQIHTGAVKNIKIMDRWVNVLDPDFNLHLREDLITEAWITRKPTSEGIVTALETYDANGDMIAQFFGKRKPGIPELPEWREAIARLFPENGGMNMPLRFATALIAGLIATGGAAGVAAAAPERVISVGGGVTEIIFALGAGPRIVAVDTTSTTPAAVTKLPSVGYMRTLSAEGVLSMRPQLLLATADAGPTQALAQIRSTGVPISIMSGQHTFESVLANVRTVAATLELKVEGERLVKKLSEDWSATQAAVSARKSRPRVLFLLAHGGTGSMMAGGEDTAADAMIRYAGAVNAAGSFKGYKPLTPEAVLGMAPDVVLITDEGGSAVGGADKLWAQASLALTPAGQSKRLVSMNALYLIGFGPRLPQAVRELSEKLHAR